MSSTTVAAAAVATAKAKSAVRPTARQLQDGYGAPQLYVTRGNDMLAQQAGKKIGGAITDVRATPLAGALLSV